MYIYIYIHLLDVLCFSKSVRYGKTIKHGKEVISNTTQRRNATKCDPPAPRSGPAAAACHAGQVRHRNWRK